MKIQSIQNYNHTFGQKDQSESKLNKAYKYASAGIIGVGVCCLASDRLFKSPKALPKISKFGFWATWAGIALVVGKIAKDIYDKSMTDNRNE